MASDSREVYLRGHPTRNAILAFFERHPDAATAADIWGDALRTDTSLSAVGYHLQVLVRNGRLVRDGSQAAPRFRLAPR